jgi:cytochrome c553
MLKLFKVLSFVVIVLSISAAFFQVVGQDASKAAQAPPPARKIPGITADDAFPHACVDCHINHPELNLDARISSLMKGWNDKVEPALLAKAQAAAPAGVTLKGKHPAAAFALKNIPTSCLTCHSKKSTLAPPFAQMLHVIHLTGGEQNHFLTVYQGECTHCHKLNTSTGLWAIPSAAEP